VISYYLCLKRKFKQWWSSIPPISTKITYDVEIPGPWLGKAWKCGGDKPVNGIRTLLT